MAEARLSVLYDADFVLSQFSGQLVAPGVLHGSFTLDPHAAWLVDQFEQIRRLFADTAGFLPRVYKDATDADLEFSIKDGKWINGAGDLQSFTGGVNLGPLTNAVANYISLPDGAATTADVTISTSAFPATTVRHIRLAVITPASSNWYPDAHMVSWLSLGVGNPIGSAALRPLALGPFTWTNLPAGQTDQPGAIGGAKRGIVMPTAGYVVGLSATVDNARAAGTLTIKPAKATTPAGSLTALTPTGLNLTIDGSATLQGSATVTYATTNYDYAVDDRLGVLITTDGSWAPTDADLTAMLYVIPDAS